MSLTELAQYPVQRIRRVRAGADALGNAVFSEDISVVLVAGWANPGGANPGGAEPKLAGHDRRIVRVELYAPVGMFHHHDAVILPGVAERLDVIGEPENYEHNPFGWAPGLEVVNLGGIE